MILATVLVSVHFLAYGLAAHWGSSQWGSYGQCVGSAATFAAVVIALRESFRGQRARAVDHEVSRRRECLKAVGDAWTGLTQMSLYLTFFTDYLENLPDAFNPNIQRQDNVPPDRPGEPLAYEIGARVQEFVNRWTDLVEPPLFVALALLKDTPFDESMKDINAKIRHLTEKELPGVLDVGIRGRRPDVASLDATWKEILRQREGHLNLARKHFSLNLRAVESELSELS
ncbi:hypothetical protein ACJH6H_29705 [Mycobacterium sp. SMC-21]